MMEDVIQRPALSHGHRLPTQSCTSDTQTRSNVPVPPSHLSWCETPKLGRKSESLRRRLLVTCSSMDSCQATPVNQLDFQSPELSPTAPLSYSTRKSEDLLFSCRKRRLLFSQALTSTVEMGHSSSGPGPSLFQDQTPEADLDESIIAGLPGSLSPHGSYLSPVRSQDQRCDPGSATPLEDSGFSSLGLDKSQDDSVDHEGSFQELVLSGSREKRCSRLERQRRLSTLREAGSQSDEGSGEQRPAVPVISKDEVFLERTPLSAATLKLQDLSLTPALQLVHVMSRSFSHPHASLEEPDPPLTTLFPLSGLIGRKMGLEWVDIVSELKMRNLRHILGFILRLMTPADLYSFGLVCDEWSDVVSADKRAAQRRRSHARQLKLLLEGGRAPQAVDAETRLALGSRSALSSVQAQARTPHPLPPPTTPTQCSAKRLQFLQVAKTLFSDEHLKPCPRCQHPARCHPLRAQGQCSWSDCGFHFCTSCMCALHGSRDCAHLSATRPRRRDLLPGSAQSKRNVRRL